MLIGTFCMEVSHQEMLSGNLREVDSMMYQFQEK